MRWLDDCSELNWLDFIERTYRLLCSKVETLYFTQTQHKSACSTAKRTIEPGLILTQIKFTKRQVFNYAFGVHKIAIPTKVPFGKHRRGTHSTLLIDEQRRQMQRDPHSENTQERETQQQRPAYLSWPDITRQRIGVPWSWFWHRRSEWVGTHCYTYDLRRCMVQFICHSTSSADARHQEHYHLKYYTIHPFPYEKKRWTLNRSEAKQKKLHDDCRWHIRCTCIPSLMQSPSSSRAHKG